MPWVSDGTPLETPESTAAEGYEQTPNAEGIAGNLALRAQSAWSEGIGALGRVSSEGQFQGSSPTQQALYQTATTDEYGQPLDPSAPTAGSVKTPMMQPDEYNKAYAPPGQSIGTEPMPQGIAQIIGDAKKAQADRDAVLARDPSSWPVRFASSAVASLVDPLNDATMFLPGIGEEAIAARLGEGALARTGARLVAGAATGAVAQAPLSAFRGVLSAQDTQDYDLRSAFQDMVTSAAVNAAFHAGFGAVGDLMKWHGDPQVKQDAMQMSVAQMIQGKPIDVDPVMQARDLTFPETIAAQNRITTMQARAGQLTREAEELRTEASRVGGIDPDTQARLDAIDDELTRPGTINPDRREDLETEKQMLTEGQAPPSELEAARDEAQRQGLNIAAERHAATVQDLYQQIADHQRMLHENGYAPGMPQGEFDTVKNRVYGPEEAPGEAGNETASATPENAAKAGPEAVEANTSNAEERNAETQNVNGQPGEKAQPVDPRVAEAERELQVAMNGGKASVEGVEPAAQLHPEDAAAIDQARAASEDANRRSDAYTEAALCMKGE